ncbi:MAG TPA: L,D-transpeptidase [Xanthobacteraceae bacterium]|jgi:lipoprotein-anchoring transpeptidase ErfK/SrfK|nr:L,D-transpeptidase [Xanthobacteraceae bacterium]
MPSSRTLTIFAAAFTALATSTAIAQDCDRFAWACQGYSPPPRYGNWEPIRPNGFPFNPNADERPYQPSYQPYDQRPYTDPRYQQPDEPQYSEDHSRKYDPATAQRFASLYGPVPGEPHQIAAVKLGYLNPAFVRAQVNYPTNEPPGTIVIDPRAHYLYLVEPNGRAIRYGVGVGRQGFGWSGAATVHDKQAWPDWYPPREMIDRQPEIRRVLTQLQSGIGMPGGSRNPLGARALYLWQGNKDTLFRIHGTIEPWTIGKNVSSGCIRMINQDVIDLYQRAAVGAKVVVLGSI